MRTCPACAPLDGWIDQIDSEGVHRLVACAHGGEGPGLVPISVIMPALQHDIERLARGAMNGLQPIDIRVARILVAHRGKANAIRSAELAARLLEGADDPDRREELRRGITKSVERLRRRAHLPIAATKESPPGYFLPETPAEWDEMFRRYRQEMVRMALNARLFRPQADLVQELRGQLAIPMEAR